jgi:ubiquinone/menaquinone biosynthesis C-methylase UbiE
VRKSDLKHADLIKDQFTRQATPFSTAATITDQNALQMIIEAAAPGPDNTVLDVACGADSSCVPCHRMCATPPGST